MRAPQQLGPYRIVRPLGQGGMGAVYEAVQEPIGRRVAVKVLLPQHAQDRDAVHRFFNEARAVNLIEHPSIVQISDYAQVPDGPVYLVMEYLRGQTLSARIEGLHKQGKRLPMREVVQLAAQLADALAAAHAKSVIHRDLKPSNVMIVPDPAVPGGARAKLLDFGIAKLARTESRGTATNEVFGTPQYMSPEQCAGAGGVDDKTDVYALGVILFEMLAGRLPFIAETPLEYMGQHAFKEPPPITELAPQTPKELSALLQRMLLKDKQVRPTMREVSTELIRLLSAASGVLGATPEEFVVPHTDPDGSTAEPASQGSIQVGPPSTLGNSLGQPLRRSPGSWRLLLLGGAVVGASMLAVGWRLWQLPVSSVAPHQVVDLAAPLVQPIGAVPTTTRPLDVAPAAPATPATASRKESIQRGSAKPKKSIPVARPIARPRPSLTPSPSVKSLVASPSPPATRPVRRED
jgi:serine/threonine protein kinase